MPDAKEERLPLWPLRLTLTVLLAIELFFILRLTAEGVTDNILMIVNSVGLLVFCVLTWRGIPWSRWLVIALLVWRVAQIGVAMSSQFAPGDHRIGGSLLLVGLYVVAGLLVASPLGRSRMRAAT
jgi:hypothetical protein